MLDARLGKSRVRDTYRRIARAYDFWAWLTERKARERCLDLAAIQDGEAVLEVAVGTGLAFEKILKSNPSGRNEGIDLTEAMIDRARKRATDSGQSNFRLRLGDAYNLDFANDSFDVLITNYLFDLLPERDFASILQEFNRVLRPDSRLVIVNMTVGRRWFNSIWTLVYRVNPALMGGCRPVQLLPYLEVAGFRQLRREYVSQVTFPSEVIRATAPNTS